MEQTRANSEVEFGAREEKEAARLIESALREDLPGEDVTSHALIPEEARVRGAFVPREGGVVCGIHVASQLFRVLDPRISSRPLSSDGAEARTGRAFLEVTGPAQPILAGERTALNFLQHLSGIATRTRAFREILAGTDAVLKDTRKTLPGWRYLEKYAVRAGGGSNHRFNLSDMALVKDNHLLILRSLGRSGDRPWSEWVQEIRSRHPGVKVEVEVESLEEFRDALSSGADIILLDNMSPVDMSRAAREAGERGSERPLLEASGGLGEGDLRAVAETGVDRISVGSLTHSAAALDIGFDILEVHGASDS